MTISLSDIPIRRRVKERFPDWDGDASTIEFEIMDNTTIHGFGSIVIFRVTFHGETEFERAVIVSHLPSNLAREYGFI